MGTDIHGVFQRRTATGWEDVECNWEQNRHYQLFAALADVRNGYGFAGIKTGEPVRPIADPRGLPEDFEVVGENHPIKALEAMDPCRREWAQKQTTVGMSVWMGDHSHSWLTADEMLAWYETAPTVVKTGYVHRPVYEAWDKKGRPPEFCGDAWGKDVVKVDDNAVAMAERPDWNYVRVEWESRLTEELDYFFNEVRALKEKYGDVRLVFGFDS